MRKAAIYMPMISGDKAWAAWKNGEKIDPADVSWRILFALDDEHGSATISIGQKFGSLDEAFTFIEKWFPDIENDRMKRLYEGSPF